MPIRVLLVDDHKVVRDGLALFLDGRSNIEVVGEAANGREAIDEVHRLKPDLVVMDIAMPDLNGIEATRMILEQLPKTKVVVLSMYAHTEYVFRALQAGASGYLLKESAATEVVNAVTTVAAGGRYLSQSISDVVLDDYIRRRTGPVSEDPLDVLSPREREVLQLMVEGKRTNEIAETVCLSPKTIETYRSRVMTKLEISNLPDLVKFAIQHGLTSIDG